MFDIDLPSGRKVAVVAPSFMDRMNAVRECRSISKDVGYILEELMAAKSIVSIDGHVVDDGWAAEPIMRMSDWTNVDVQYFIEFFMTAFFPDDKLKEKAQEEAKKLMKGESGPAQSKARVKPTT